MAHYKSIIEFEGQLNGMVFYNLNGKKVVRAKAKGIGQRIKNDVNYAGTLKRAQLFGTSNAIATAIYRMAKLSQVPLNYKVHGKLVGLVQKLVLQESVFNYLTIARGLDGLQLAKNLRKDSVQIVTRNFNCLNEATIGSKLLLGQFAPVVNLGDGFKTENTMAKIATFEIDTNNVSSTGLTDQLKATNFNWDICIAYQKQEV